MTESFPVRLAAPDVPKAGDRTVLFHGVNKSGSLAIANVMRDAYRAAGRAEQFVSVYHGDSKSVQAMADVMARRRGHAFYISHNVYRAVEPPPGAALVTQLRHPLPRVLSIHGWMKRNHLRRHGTLERLPSLEQWVRSTRGLSNTQMAQFAIGFPLEFKANRQEHKARVLGMSTKEMLERALESFDRDVGWFGIADLFEESIFSLAHICGIEAVPAWQKDTRNRWRQSLQESDDRVVELILETFDEEIQFYENRLAEFRRRIARIDFGPSLPIYKERCSAEYGERVIAS